MPNWCSTDYQIVGKQQNVENLFKELQKVLSTDRSDKKRDSFLPDTSWIGYVASDILDIDSEKECVPCRGSISYMDEKMDDDENLASFTLSTETAWTDCRKLFYLLSIKFDVEILFYTEELGCDIHETNDEEGRYFDTRYLLDDSEDEMSYYSSFGEFAKEIEDMTGEKPDKFEDVDDILERHELSETMNAHQIDIVSLQDF